MPVYSVTFARSARKELAELPDNLLQRIFTKIESLARDPRPAGCKKLQGPAHLWRIRIGDYRVVYEIDDRRHNIDIVIVRHRKDAYR